MVPLPLNGLVFYPQAGAKRITICNTHIIAWTDDRQRIQCNC